MRNDSTRLRDMILMSAKDSLQSRGYKGTRMADIAKSCGISKKTIYEYFPSKRELLHEVADREVLRFRMAVFRDLGGVDSYTEKFQRMIENSIEHFRFNPVMKNLYWDSGGIFSRETPPGMEALANEAYEIARDLIAGGIRTGEFRDLDPDITAATMANTFISIILGELEGLGMGLDVPDLLRQAIDILMFGLEKT